MKAFIEAISNLMPSLNPKTVIMAICAVLSQIKMIRVAWTYLSLVRWSVWMIMIKGFTVMQTDRRAIRRQAVPRADGER